jgi:hypothetical protein
MTGKLIIHGCGGAGIDVTSEVSKAIEKLGSGFAEIRPLYIDTTNNNIQNVDHGKDDFFLIEAQSHKDHTIVGSGGLVA